MGRVLFLAVLIYCYGDPGFDGHRPEPFDRPLRDFHHAIDSAGRDARRALIAVEDPMPKIRGLGDKLRHLGKALTPS